MDEAPVREFNKGQPEAAKINDDLYGPLNEGLHHNTYALQLTDALTSFYEVHAIASKDKVSNVGPDFTNKVNKHLANQSTRVRMIGADNGPENMPKELS